MPEGQSTTQRGCAPSKPRGVDSGTAGLRTREKRRPTRLVPFLLQAADAHPRETLCLTGGRRGAPSGWRGLTCTPSNLEGVPRSYQKSTPPTLPLAQQPVLTARPHSMHAALAASYPLPLETGLLSGHPASISHQLWGLSSPTPSPIQRGPRCRSPFPREAGGPSRYLPRVLVRRPEKEGPWVAAPLSQAAIPGAVRLPEQS